MSEDINKLDNICERLIKQRSAAIQYYTYLKDIIDNESRWEKYKDSFSGNVINLTLVSFEQSLILFCDRVWDKSNDSQSIPNVMKILKRTEEEIIIRRSKDIDAEFTKDFPQKIKKQIERVLRQAEKLHKSKVKKVIRVIRTENYAHLVDASHDRVRNFPNGFDNHNVNRYDLINYAEETIRLIEDLEVIRSGTSYDFDESSKVFQKYCSEYWKHLPVFRDVEKN